MSADAEVIISMVEQQPAIWDKGSEEYKDRVEKDKAWIAVANGVYEEWDSLSKEEQTKKSKYQHLFIFFIDTISDVSRVS